MKIWTADGRIVYSDEPKLIGETFPLGEEEREMLSCADRPDAICAARAEVSDLSEGENTFERDYRPSMLEVYGPVWTPEPDTPLLFETYAPYTTSSISGQGTCGADSPG